MRIESPVGEDSRSYPAEPKPKLLFIRSTASDRAGFIRKHLDEHVKCLSLFFDVVLIDSDDCDYKRLCETYKPDLVLFESGTYVSLDKRRNIRNLDAFPDIPRLGLCNADAYCETRKIFLSDMSRWNVDTFFTISVSMGEYTPEICDRLFTWPNFADGDLFKDYGEKKHIPVLFSGSLATHYPWRNRIFNRVSRFYPSLTCPHFGWGGEQQTKRTIFGEQYARLLNASVFVPSCGTIANELVRKHFEIPAARACLVAQLSPAIQAAGFIDMQNCVLADEDDVLDKLDYLSAHPDELEGITDAGFKLVRANHLLTHRNQIYQWFRCYQELRSDQRIVQPGPFQPLVVVHKDSGIWNSHVPANGLDRQLLRLGDEKLQSGRYAEAKELFIKCLNYHTMAEAYLRMAVAHLLEGNASEAQRWCWKQIEITLERHGGHTPDPVEWAYAIVIELCRGSEGQALELAWRFPYLRHAKLDGARCVAQIASGRNLREVGCLTSSTYQYSIHQLPQQGCEEWTTHICRMLNACGQGRIVERILSAIDKRQTISLRDEEHHASAAHQAPGCEARRPLAIARLVPQRWRHLSYVRQAGKGILHKAEKWFGYFLPYRLSTARSNDFYRELERVSSGEDIAAVVVVGARANNYVTEACLEGVQANPNLPLTFFVSCSETSVPHLEERYSNGRCLPLDRFAVDAGMRALEEATTLLVIDGSEVSRAACRSLPIARPKVIVLWGINKSCTYETHQSLVARREYTLLAHCPNESGYSIFEFIGADCARRARMEPSAKGKICVATSGPAHDMQ